MRFYAVVFDRVADKSYGEFHEEFVGHPGITTWWHYVKSCYLVGTDMDAEGITDHFAAVAKKHGLPRTHLTIEVKLNSRQGYQTDQSWKWFRKYGA
jgi:hypothetical protein